MDNNINNINIEQKNQIYQKINNYKNNTNNNILRKYNSANVNINENQTQNDIKRRDYYVS